MGKNVSKINFAGVPHNIIQSFVVPFENTAMKIALFKLKSNKNVLIQTMLTFYFVNVLKMNAQIGTTRDSKLSFQAMRVQLYRVHLC